jgi:hypothetical protein
MSLLSASPNGSNHQGLFTIQFTPATYFLVMLTIEDLVKFDKRNLILIFAKLTLNYKKQLNL